MTLLKAMLGLPKTGPIVSVAPAVITRYFSFRPKFDAHLAAASKDEPRLALAGATSAVIPLQIPVAPQVITPGESPSDHATIQDPPPEQSHRQKYVTTSAAKQSPVSPRQPVIASAAKQSSVAAMQPLIDTGFKLGVLANSDVVPAKAGTQSSQSSLDPRRRGDDDAGLQRYSSQADTKPPVIASAAKQSPVSPSKPVIASEAKQSPVSPSQPVIASAAKQSPVSPSQPVIASAAKQSPVSPSQPVIASAAKQSPVSPSQPVIA
ncbi:MAG: hypothetical protein FJY67_11925, partial [Calditrichaeota bacterium]|nr:hypothetical protein [Calditrichota bacterium]